MHKNILITGGAGFIGSHLAEALLNQGRHVTIVDDLSTGKWANLLEIESHPNFRPIIGNVADTTLLNSLVPEHQLVYHLASTVGVKLVVNKPVETVNNIFNSSEAVLKACARYRCPVVLTSTSEVYGKGTALPFREDGDLTLGSSERPRWAYACAKALDEFLALAHWREHALPAYIVRLFNTVGPRQTSEYGMVLPSFVRQALNRDPITVYGDGAQSRCFSSVFDIVEGLVRLPTVKAAEGSVINLGSQEEVTISGLALRVKELANSDSEIQYVPYRTAYGAGFEDMQRRVPDLTRARTLLGWNVRYKLDDIIMQVIDYERGRRAPALTTAIPVAVRHAAV